MSKMKFQRNYIATLLNSVGSITEGEIELQLSVTPISDSGFIILAKGNEKEEYMYYHRKEGSNIYVYGVNRSNPVTHEENTQVILVSSIEAMNYLSQLSQDQFYTFKKTPSEVIIKGGKIYEDGQLILVEDLDTSLNIEGKLLVTNVTNYAYIENGEIFITQINDGTKYIISEIDINNVGLVSNIRMDKPHTLRGLIGKQGDKGDKGDTGKAIEFIWNGTQLGIRKEGDIEYTYSNLKGDPGKEVEFRNTGTYIQWRYVGDLTWLNLILVSDLIGEQGDKGDPGYTPIKGTDYFDGIDGKTITNIEFNKVGKTTTLTINGDFVDAPKIFEIEDGLDGQDGQDGIDGKTITSVSSEKVGKTTTVTISGTFPGSPYIYTTEDGVDGEGAGDMLKSENLSGLADPSIARTNLGLGDVNNTSDINKPISTATQTALDEKVDKVVGKGLSTEDYTTAEKDKLAGIDLSTKQDVLLEGPFVDGDKSKLVGIEANAQVNIVNEAPTDGEQYARKNAGWVTVEGGNPLAVLSDTAGITGADRVENIISLTKAEYDAITPDASTIYNIIDDGVDVNAVLLDGDQTIDGEKKFTSSPIVPTPTLGTQAVNKDYVDNNSGGDIDFGGLTATTSLAATDEFIVNKNGNKKITRTNLTRSLDVATETTLGVVERATDTEAVAGTDTTRYITPKQIKISVDGGIYDDIVNITTLQNSDQMSVALINGVGFIRYSSNSSSSYCINQINPKPLSNTGNSGAYLNNIDYIDLEGVIRFGAKNNNEITKVGFGRAVQNFFNNITLNDFATITHNFQDGFVTLTTCNGSAITTSANAPVNYNFYNKYRLILKPGSFCALYINNNLAVTQTTNIPRFLAAPFFWGMGHSSNGRELTVGGLKIKTKYI